MLDNPFEIFIKSSRGLLFFKVFGKISNFSRAKVPLPTDAPATPV